MDCVELSEKRSLINAYANRDAGDVEILVGNFSAIEPHLGNDYDVVTLIGVLEYAAAYMGDSPDPFVDLLQKAMAHVAPGGRLVVAIENRLGLKYFAGCREDHSGVFFEGIEGYDPKARAQTFSLGEWKAMLARAGVAHYRFYYPYPDYKLPLQIFSDHRLPRPGELTRNQNNYDRSRLKLFDEDKAWDGLLAGGLFPEFSNSFLIEIGNGPLAEEQVLYNKSSNERAPEFSLQTCFVKGQLQSDSMYCKYPDSPAARTHVQKILTCAKELEAFYAPEQLRINRCSAMGDSVQLEVLEGETLEEKMDACSAADGIADYMRKFFARTQPSGKLVSFSETEGFREIFGSMPEAEGLPALPVADLDMIFSNVICNAEGWHLIDYEWTVSFPVPAEFLRYRALHYYLDVSSRRQELRETALEICQIDPSRIPLWEEMERRFQKYILGNYVPIQALYGGMTPGVTDIRALEDPERRAQGERIRLYWAAGEELSEERVLSFPMEEGWQRLRVTLPEGTTLLRLDPGERSALCAIRAWTINGRAVKILSHNGVMKQKGTWVFPQEDPQWLVSCPAGVADVMEMELKVQPVDADLLQAIEKTPGQRRGIRIPIPGHRG